MSNKINQYSIKKDNTEFEKIQITNSEDSAKFIRQFYHDDIGIYESFFILLLNRANKTVGYAKISQGGVTGTVVDVKIICKYVIDSLASSVILAHNHPSGNLQPSEADRTITRKIRQALQFFDTKVLDHIILTEDSHYSFGENDLLT